MDKLIQEVNAADIAEAVKHIDVMCEEGSANQLSRPVNQLSQLSVWLSVECQPVVSSEREFQLFFTFQFVTEGTTQRHLQYSAHYNYQFVGKSETECET
jgi:hypothetical protein